jgi:HPt (histidine-containing phosphotransfer) domain-containing protein
MTANAMRSDLEACLEAGMDDYISKPVMVNALIDAIKRCAAPGAGIAELVAREEPPPAVDILDENALKQLRAMLGKRATEMLPGLVQTYINDSRELINSARSALGSQDAEGLRRAAHTLKSTSANFGALRVSTLCRELEAASKDGQFEGTLRLLERIEHEQALAEAALMQVVQV